MNTLKRGWQHFGLALLQSASSDIGAKLLELQAKDAKGRWTTILRLNQERSSIEAACFAYESVSATHVADILNIPRCYAYVLQSSASIGLNIDTIC